MKTELKIPESKPELKFPLIVCEACGYAGKIDTYLPSFSLCSDCRCPKCGSTNNQHNADYASQLQKAWMCKHVGTLANGGTAANGQPLLKCTDCGCVGLDWAMRGERPTSVNVE